MKVDFKTGNKQIAPKWRFCHQFSKADGFCRRALLPKSLKLMIAMSFPAIAFFINL